MDDIRSEFDNIKNIIMNEVKYTDEYKRDLLHDKILRNTTEVSTYMNGYLDAFDFVLRNHPGHSIPDENGNMEPDSYDNEFNKIIEEYNLKTWSKEDMKFTKGSVIKAEQFGGYVYMIVVDGAKNTNRNGREMDKIIFFTSIDKSLSKMPNISPIKVTIIDEGKEKELIVDAQNLHTACIYHDDKGFDIVTNIGESKIKKLLNMKMDIDKKNEEKYSSLNI